LKENPVTENKVTISWNIGGGLLYGELFNLCQLIRLINQANPSRQVAMSVYDCHQGMIWNGGRVIQRGNCLTKEEALAIVRRWNELGVGFHFTFSNHLIEKHHLDDKRCNFLLEGAHNPLNGIVCSSDLLLDYVRRRYPGYRIKCSVMKPYLEGAELWRSRTYYQELLGRYDVVVLSPRLNQDYEFLAGLETRRVELLANEACFSDCPYTRQHYRALNLANISGDYDDIEATYFFCRKKHNGDFPKDSPMALAAEQLKPLEQLGVTRFKLQGRTDGFNQGLRRDIQRLIIEPNLVEGISLVF